jgi:2-methylcitrate dehydratase PrpD
MSTLSLSRRIARHALARRATIPADIAAKVRLHVADSIGIALGARHQSAFAADPPAPFPLGSSAGPCAILGSTRRVDAAASAFANSALMHVLDFDDIHDAARLHPTPVTLPAALAVAEETGATLDEVRTAVAIGNDLLCGLGLMLKPAGSGPASSWFLTQLLGYFASALAAGLVMGFDEDELVSALGLAYMQAAGAKEAGFGVGSNARSIYPAFAAMGGVTAVRLARGGIDGPESGFDGPSGLFAAYLGGVPGEAALSALLDPDTWHFRATEAKPWPCCRLSHPYVAAAFALREQVGRAPVTRIVAHVNASAAKLCRPLAQRRVPQTLQDAKYSVPFMTAFALAHGRVDLEVLGFDAVRDAAVLRLASVVEIEESLPDGPGHPPAVVEVHAGGATFRSPVGVPPVLDARGIRAKFDACIAHAGTGLDAARLWESLVDSPHSICVTNLVTR